MPTNKNLVQQTPQTNLASDEWDFSRLVGRPNQVQIAALSWEKGRTCGMNAKPWIRLSKGEKPRKHHVPAQPALREISHTDFARFLHDFDGRPRHWLEGGARINNPVNIGEIPHVLLIPWKDFRVEQIVAELGQWARAQVKQVRQRRLRRIDPMSDLWALACYRLRTQGRLTYPEIAATLNSLPKFKAKRSRFDEDCARKACKEAKVFVAEDYEHMQLLKHVFRS